MFKRSTALLLVIVMLATAMSSCTFLLGNDNLEDESNIEFSESSPYESEVESLLETLESIFSESENESSEPDTEEEVMTDTESVVESETEAEKESETEDKTVRPVENVVLANTSSYLYTVILSKSLEEETQANILNKVLELYTNYGIKIRTKVETQNDKIGNTANEILVGVTERPESQAQNKIIASGEALIDYNIDSHRVSILGTTSELTYEAFEHLITYYLDINTATITISNDLHYVKKSNYPLQSVKINGVDIREYSIIVPSLNPSEEELYAYYTALNIADYLEARLGVELKIVDDNRTEFEYEILIGETNRDESSASVNMGKGQYILANKDTKLVLRGNGIYVAAGMGDIVSKYLSGKSKSVNITDLPTKDVVKNYSTPTDIKNVILMIGDGMGYNQINSALNTRLNSFAAQSFTSAGTSATRSISVINGDSTYTDSAAGGTALSTGYKTINGYVGKDQNKNNLINIRELADLNGAKTAVITTDVITGATPSAFLTHNISRENTEELQISIDQLIAAKKIEYCEGSVDNDLTLHTRNALNTIAYSSSPFFMMVEEGYIDKNCHNNKTEKMLDTVVRFNDAIIYAAAFSLVNADTVLVVTADHETGGLVEDSESETGYVFTTGNHTNADVPIYVLGADKFNGERVENVEIPKFLATYFGAMSFGYQSTY